LLLGEAQRRSGSLEQATANWIQAVKVGESLLGRPTPVFDPGFWERAAYLRSVKATWPESLGRAFARHSRLETPTTSGSEEALLWASVGQVRLDRLEPHSALAACKRAESMLFESSMRDHMVLMQAQTLIHLNQGSTALTLLATLSTKPGSVAPRALALMGGLKLKEGNHTQSAALLTRALDYKGAKDWPGQAEAEADLGLTLLILGKEEEGLQRLRAAQKRADVTRDQEFLLECLGNEARYLEHRGKTSEAATLRTKIKQMEAGG
jgi:ATP/maltotriose-dependent transcriptional regulator MalT